MRGEWERSNIFAHISLLVRILTFKMFKLKKILTFIIVAYSE